MLADKKGGFNYVLCEKKVELYVMRYKMEDLNCLLFEKKGSIELYVMRERGPTRVLPDWHPIFPLVGCCSWLIRTTQKIE